MGDKSTIPGWFWECVADARPQLERLALVLGASEAAAAAIDAVTARARSIVSGEKPEPTHLNVRLAALFPSSAEAQPAGQVTTGPGEIESALPPAEVDSGRRREALRILRLMTMRIAADERRRLARRLFIRGTRTEELASATTGRPPASPEEQTEARQLLLTLVEAVDELPEDSRDLLVRVVLAGGGQGERLTAADRVRLHRIRKNLKLRLLGR